MLLIAVLLLSCGNKRQPPVYEDLVDFGTEDSDVQEVVKIPFRSVGGVKFVKVTVNGVGFDMIFDTGCSGALISMAEANYLYQKGRLSVDDILGVSQSMIADGSIVENMVVNLREVVIGDQIYCPNVQATVSNNIDAPLLLGNEILDRVATITIDNENEELIFNIR
jgi:predicted aspartyl protease